MIYLNHTTKFGNSFNLVFFQNILKQELGLSSVYPNGKNFASYFERNIFNKYCTSEFLTNGFFERATELNGISTGKHIPEQLIHNLTTVNSRGFYEAEFNGLKVLSTTKNVQLNYDDLLYNGPIILNRAHYFHLPNMAELKKKHQECLRTELVFNNEAACSINSIAKEYIRSNVFCVGLHMRRTDYKDYMDGRYYFDLELYKEFSNSFLNNYRGDAVVFVFTDDKDSAAGFESEKIKVITSTQMEDFVTMTKMNLLVGPPSSFSNAASFIGKVPRQIMRDNSDFALGASPEKIVTKKWFPHVA